METKARKIPAIQYATADVGFAENSYKEQKKVGSEMKKDIAVQE